MNEMNELVDEVLTQGRDDWLMLVNIFHIAEARRVDDRDAARGLAVALVSELVEDGWMVPGELDDSGFEPWSTDAAGAVARIVDALESADWDIMHNVIAWFSNTEKGDERAGSRKR